MLFPFMVSQFCRQALGKSVPVQGRVQWGVNVSSPGQLPMLLLASFGLSGSGGGRGTGEHPEESWHTGQGWSRG